MRKYYVAQTAAMIAKPFEFVNYAQSATVNATIKAGDGFSVLGKKVGSMIGSAVESDTSSDEEEEDDDGEQELNISFPEFIFLLTSHLVDEVLPGGDWKASAYHMRLLRNAFDTADVDGNNELEYDELEMVVMSLHPGHGLTGDDLQYLWSLIKGDDQEREFVIFIDFLKGMVKMKNDPRLDGKISLLEPNKWELVRQPRTRFVLRVQLNSLSS